MKRNLIRIGAGLLAAAFLAVGAAAAETPAPTALPADAKLAEPIPVIPEGMLRLPVTSALAEDKSDLSVLFDGKADTGLTPTFAEGEEAVFSFRTATGIAKILSGFAVITEGEEGTVLNVRVSGSNDGMADPADWTPIALRFPVVKTEGYNVFSAAEPEEGWKTAEKFAFYRFEFSVEEGTSFSISELLLIRPDTGEPEAYYAPVDEVKFGETPPVLYVPVAEPEPEKPAPHIDRSRFGIFYPGVWSFGNTAGFPFRGFAK